jgi:hypothetical protein
LLQRRNGAQVIDMPVRFSAGLCMVTDSGADTAGTKSTADADIVPRLDPHSAQSANRQIRRPGIRQLQQIGTKGASRASHQFTLQRLPENKSDKDSAAQLRHRHPNIFAFISVHLRTIYMQLAIDQCGNRTRATPNCAPPAWRRINPPRNVYPKTKAIKISQCSCDSDTQAHSRSSAFICGPFTHIPQSTNAATER